MENNLVFGDAVDEFGTQAYMILSQKDIQSLADDIENRGKASVTDRMVMGDKLIGYGNVRFLTIAPGRHPTISAGAIRRLPVWLPTHVGVIQEEMKWVYHNQRADFDDHDTVTCRSKIDYVRLDERGCYEILVQA
jgi:hypothetical protein